MTSYLKSALLLFVVLFAHTLGAQTPTDGFNALQLENWDDAIQIHTMLAQKAPTNQLALLRLGDAYLGKGDKGNALATFKKTYDANPDGTYALIANGRVKLLENQAAEADKQFAKAARMGKKDVNALRAIGESYLYGATRNLTRAEQLLKTAYELKTKDVETLMQLGYCYKEMPNGGLAAQHYEFAQQADPDNIMAIFMQARVYRQAKLPEKYVDYLGKTVKKDPTNTLALRETAEYWYFTKRRYTEATTAYENLIANGKGANVEDEMQLANCYYLTKNYDKCISLVEKIVGKDGSKNYLRRLLGYCYFETGDFKKAKSILDEYFKVVQPEKVLASDHEYLARTIIKTGGDTLSAIDNYRKALIIDPQTWYNYKEIGLLQYRMRNYCDAANSIQIAVDSSASPDATDLFYVGNGHYYCRTDSTKGKYERALLAYSKVVELAPTYLPGLMGAGRSAAKLDVAIPDGVMLVPEFGKAQPYFEKYVEVAGVDVEKNKRDLVTAYEYLVYMHYLRGNVDGYLSATSKLIAIDPTNETALGLQGEFERRGRTLGN